MANINPADLKTYQRQFQESVQLFSDALDSHHKVEHPNKTVEHRQKEMYRDVMDKTSDVMDKTIEVVPEKMIQEQEKILVQHYQNYLDNETEENYTLLKSDINQIQSKLK